MTTLIEQKESARRSNVINMKIDDLITLAELRANSDTDGSTRFKMLNTMIDLLCLSSHEDKYNRMLNYRDKLGLRIQDGDIQRRYHTVYFSDVYQKKNIVLVKELEITEEEQKSMKILIERKEKNRRSNLRRNGDKKVRNLVKKVREKEKIKQLRSQGYSYSKIAEELNITKSRVYYLDQAYNKKRSEAD